MNNKKKVFVTGASGKIGRLLVEKLLAGGYELVLLERRDRSENRLNGGRTVKGDILDAATYSSELGGVDTVLHMAAITHTNVPGSYFKVNVEGTRVLMGEALKAGVKRVIYVSTRAASPNGGGYSVSKLEAEGIVQESGMEWVILRPAEVYGASGKEGIDMLLNKLSSFPIIPVIGDGRYRVAPVHVSDVVSSVVTVLGDTSISGKIYTIAGPEAFTYNELIDRVLRIKGIKRPRVHIPVWIFRMAARILLSLQRGGGIAMDQLPRLLCSKEEDISPAQRDFSFCPRSMDEVFFGMSADRDGKGHSENDRA